MIERKKCFGDFKNLDEINPDEQSIENKSNFSEIYPHISNNDSYDNSFSKPKSFQEASTNSTGNKNYLCKKTNREITENEKIFGRKKKGSKEDRTHTKKNKDNMILKIKNYFINSILVLLNSSFIFRGPEFFEDSPHTNKFLKIEAKINRNIKKDDSINMLDQKLKDILSNDVSPKYFSIDKKHNEELIQKILEQNKEKNIINILELTYKEMLDIFRGTVNDELKEKIKDIETLDHFSKIDDFLETIKIKEQKNGESEEFIKDYIEKITELCKEFESWFRNKRNRKSHQ